MPKKITCKCGGKTIVRTIRAKGKGGGAGNAAAAKKIAAKAGGAKKVPAKKVAPKKVAGKPCKCSNPFK